MNWNEIPAEELLEKIKDESLLDQEKILNDYIIEKYQYLTKVPQKLLPLLEAAGAIVFG